MSVAQSQSQTSSRATQAEGNRSDRMKESAFQTLALLNFEYPEKLAALGFIFQLIQPLAFTLNPHVGWGHQISWKIIYASHIPFWDETYNDQLGYTGFFVLFWAFLVLILITALTLLYGSMNSHTASLLLKRGHIRHLIIAFSSAFLIPLLHMSLSACVYQQNAAGNDIPWLLAGTPSSQTIPLFVGGVVAAAVLVSVAFVSSSCSVTVGGNFSGAFNQGYTYMERLTVVYKVLLVVAFHMLLSRNMKSAYHCVVAIVCFTMAGLHSLTLSYTNEYINRAVVISFAVSGSCAITGLIYAKSPAEATTSNGELYVILLCSCAVSATLFWFLGGVRINVKTLKLFEFAERSQTIPREQNPFAIAALQEDTDLLPFPANLPLSDYAFSPHRFVESDIVEEMIRMEKELQSEEAFSATKDNLEEYIDRIQVVSPMIKSVLLPTDSEVACRFLREWVLRIGQRPTPHMLSFASRIYCKALMLFPTSPATVIHFVLFLTTFAPALSRLNLSVTLLEDVASKVYCDFSDSFCLFLTSKIVRTSLGLRDKTHAVIFNEASKTHKESLVQAAGLWRMLEERKHSIVTLAAVSSRLTEATNNCLMTYRRALTISGNDEVLLRSFGVFLKAVFHYQDVAELCEEEAAAISQKRRARLVGDVRSERKDGGSAVGSIVSGASSLTGGGEGVTATGHIIGQVEDKIQQFRNLTSSTIQYSTVAVFAVLFVLIAVLTGVLISESLDRQNRIDQIHSMGRQLTVSQQALYTIYNLAEEMQSASPSTYQVNKLAAMTYELEAQHNAITHGSSQLVHKVAVKYLEQPNLPIDLALGNASNKVVAVGFWDYSYMFVAGLHRVLDTVRNAPSTGHDLLADKDVRFIMTNGPEGMSSATNGAMSVLFEADKKSAQNSETILIIVLVVILVVTTCVSLVFLWNFKVAASTRVKALRLFTLIPKDAVKRLYNEAKDNVEFFLSGAIVSDAGQQAHATLDQSLKGADLDSSLSDEKRRSSSLGVGFSQQLLHKFIEKGDGVEVKHKEEEQEAAGTKILSLLGSEVEGKGELEQSSSQLSSTPSMNSQDKRVSFLSQNQGSPQAGGAKRKASVSFGRIVAAHRASSSGVNIDEFGDVFGSESDEDAVTIPSFEALATSEETVKASVATKVATIEWNVFSSISLVVMIVFCIAGSILGISYSSSSEAMSLDLEHVKALSLEYSATVTHVSSAESNGLLLGLSGFYNNYLGFIHAKSKADAALTKLYGDLNHRAVDADAFQDIETGLRRSLIGVSLIAKSYNYTDNLIPEVASVSWQRPAENTKFDARYREAIFNHSAEFSYTSTEQDLAKSPQEMRLTGLRTLLDQFAQGDIKYTSKGFSSMKGSILDNIASEISKEKEQRSWLLILAIILFTLALGGAFAFSVMWKDSRAVKLAAILLTVSLVVAVGFSAYALSDVSPQCDHLKSIFDHATALGKLASEVYGIVEYSSAYILFGQTHDLYSFLKATEDTNIEREVASISHRVKDVDSVFQYFKLRATLSKKLHLGVYLATLAYGDDALYSKEISFNNWDIEKEPDYDYHSIVYKKEINSLYNNQTYDTTLPRADLAKLATNLIHSHKLTDTVVEVQRKFESMFENIRASHRKDFEDTLGVLEVEATAVLGISIAVLVIFAFFIVTLCVIAFESLTPTVTDVEVYEAMFSKMTKRSVILFSICAVFFSAICICGIVFSTEMTDAQVVIGTASERSWVVATAMTAAESTLKLPLSEMRHSQQRLQELVKKATEIEQQAYFGSGLAMRMRNRQQEALFGPSSLYQVQDVRVTGLSTGTKCTDYANTKDGNLATVEIQFIQFFRFMSRIAQFQIEDLLQERRLIEAGGVPGTNSLTALVTESRRHVDKLMTLLGTSDSTYSADISEMHTMRRIVLIALLIACFFAVCIIYILGIRPLIEQLQGEEVGAKLLLNVLPQEIRTSIPEINDFFDADSGGKDDQLKKKLLQSEKLLQNILPPVISRRLKNGEVCIADTHPEVTVIFAALIGFDEYSGKMLAQDIVIFLNDLIVTFDHVVDLLELEKIKTIGDVYFLCGGLTPKTKTNHPLLCMECAIIFLEALKDHNERHNTPNLTLRIGVNSDPAVAGVIGSTKVAYDLWGDSVNTASRMQSTGIPGKIQVSHNTYKVPSIQRHYTFSDRKIEAKGKGQLTTHVYESRKIPGPYQHLKWRVHR